MESTARTDRNRKQIGDQGHGAGLKSDQGIHRAVEQRRVSALCLVRSRGSHSRHRSNDDSEVSRRQLAQPPLAHIIDSAKVTSSTSTGFACVGESPFHELATETLESRVSRATNPAEHPALRTNWPPFSESGCEIAEEWGVAS